MLIESPRHTTADLAWWRSVCEPEDAVRAQLRALEKKAAKALSTMRLFANKHAGEVHVSCSWGKDSTVLAHLAWRLLAEGIDLPVVYVKVNDFYSPDCPITAQRFFAAFPGQRYDEICVDAGPNRAGGTSAHGFAEAKRRHGQCYFSGVRGAESKTRSLRMQSNGTDTRNTCAPIGWWSGEDVFAYLHKHQVPTHPAYGMTVGGMLDRKRIRVSSLGGERGTGHGRREWEQRYYPEVEATR